MTKLLLLLPLLLLSSCGAAWDRTYTHMALHGAATGNPPPTSPAPEWQSPLNPYGPLR